MIRNSTDIARTTPGQPATGHRFTANAALARVALTRVGFSVLATALVLLWFTLLGVLPMRDVMQVLGSACETLSIDPTLVSTLLDATLFALSA